MKTTIYYFTGTGNSLKIARDLATTFSECDLVPIARIWQQESIAVNSPRIGFVFPVYGGGVPRIVRTFISHLDFSESEYIFGIANHAGGPGDVLDGLDILLKARQAELHAGFLIKMPNNYVIGYNMQTEAKQQEILGLAAEELEQIAKSVHAKENNRSHLNQAELEKSSYDRDPRGPDLSSRDEGFFVDERCTSCQICEDICPVENIELIKGLPEWKHNCEFCLACMNFCPEQSIQYGPETISRERYHHPEITVEDMIGQKE